MNKYLLIFLFFLLNSTAYAQFTTTIQWHNAKTSRASDTIYYDLNSKLDWADFKGKPDAGNGAAAITESGFGYRISMQSVNGKANLIITVFCYFNKNNSLVKKGMNTDYALLHEQHHFDITYINAFLFIQKLRVTRLTKNNFASAVEKIHDECFAQLGQMQDAYDGETKNGRLSNQQSVWNKKIDRQLESLFTD